MRTRRNAHLYYDKPCPLCGYVEQIEVVRRETGERLYLKCGNNCGYKAHTQDEKQ